MPLGRAIVFRIGERVRHQKFGDLRVLIVGSDELGLAVLRNLVFSSGAGRKAVGFITEDVNRVGTAIELRTGTGDVSIPIVGQLIDIESVIRDHAVDEIIVAPGSQTVDELLTMQRQATEFGVRILYLPHVYPLFWHNLTVFNVGRLPLLGFNRRGQDWLYRFSKRTFDVVSSSVALILLSPLLFLVGVLVK